MMAGSMLSNAPLTLKTTITTVMGTGSTFEIYETDIEVLKASVVFRNKLQLERFQIDIALGGVCTIVKRGLSNGMTKVEVVGNKKEWNSGAEGYITVLASDLLDVDNTGDKQVLTGDFEFTEDVEVKGELKSSSNFKVTGKSNPQPNFTTELERDAVYTAPLNGDKCTVAGIDYSYNSSTVQWEAKGVSTPLPDATTIVKGKARLATQAEVLAGVVTDAIVTPETLAGKPAPSSFIITSDYPLGEPITDITKSCVFKETAPTFAQASVLPYGDTLPYFGTTSALMGCKILTKKICILNTVNIIGGVTRCILKNVGGTTLATASVVGSVATFNYPLDNSTNYRIEADNSGGSYNQYMDTSFVTTIGLNINIVGGSDNGSDYANMQNISSITTTESLYSQNIGDVAGNTRVSFPAIGTGVASNSLKLSLAKVLSPTAFLRVRIETDNAGSPSGTLVDPNATKDIDPATLTTSLADTTVLMGATVANAHGVTLNVNETSQTVYKGVKFTLTQQVGAVSVDKVAGCTATKAYLYDLAGNLLTSAPFSTNTATLNYNGLVNGESYYIMVGSDGSPYTSVKQTGASAYPYTAGRLNYVGGSYKGIGANTTSIGNYSGGGPTTGARTFTFTVQKDCYLSSFVPSNSGYDQDIVLSTTVLSVLKNNSGTVLATASDFVGNFTKSAGTLLIAGNTYKIDYMVKMFSGRMSTSAPTGSDINITFVSDSGGGGYINKYSLTTTEAITNITDINNITSISTNDTIIIPSGQKVHTVVSAVGDVVNASNYYKIGYSTNDTTTRPLAKRNTTRGAATSTIFPYISSTLFHNTVLSLTDSDFAYKVALYGVATALGAIGTYPKLTVFGASDNFTGMTEGGTQYLGPTPGGIQSSAGTNSFAVGKARNATKLRVKDLIS